MKKTIAAIITPRGIGAISGIRVSGTLALEISSKIFSKNLQEATSHTAHLGSVCSLEEKISIDQAIALVMKAPNTYTGEDVVEFFCHGSPILTKKIFDELILAGAFPAKAGEFTFRAFQNGKIDLAQAESVQTLIASESSLAADAAKTHLEGALSKKIAHWQKILTDIAAIFEASVDFPEEGLSFKSRIEIEEDIQNILQDMRALKDSFSDGKKLQEGASFCLLGAPNAGKSSLLNALLRKDRAIVTSVAGTTRDLLEETLFIKGLPFILIDTAGLRSEGDLIEKEGMKRSKKALEEADFSLVVLDSSKPIPQEIERLLPLLCKEKTLIVWNKSDLQKPQKLLAFPKQTVLSAKTLDGIEKLKEHLVDLAWDAPSEKPSLILTQKRHLLCIEKAMHYAEKALLEMQAEGSFEFMAVDMKSALGALAEIIGRNVSEDVLSSIFSQFCVGK